MESPRNLSESDRQMQFVIKSREQISEIEEEIKNAGGLTANQAADYARRYAQAKLEWFQDLVMYGLELQKEFNANEPNPFIDFAKKEGKLLQNILEYADSSNILPMRNYIMNLGRSLRKPRSNIPEQIQNDILGRRLLYLGLRMSPRKIKR